MNHRTTLAVALVACGCGRSAPTPPVAPDVPRAVDPNPPTDLAPRLVAFGSADAVRTWIRAHHVNEQARRARQDEALRAWIRAHEPPHLSRQAALSPVANRGIFAALGASGGVAGGPSGVVSPFGAMTESGADNMSGDTTGDAFGYGGLGAASAPTTPGARVDGADGITNNQTEGVDEGDIVKAHGEHLVILRRGRLFSVRLGADALTPVSMVDAYGRGRAPGSYYDEMLVDGDTVVVIGYNNRAQATEVGLFDISAAGVIAWRDTLFVRSSDYYSSRNYASRLVGHHLVMYAPVPLRLMGDQASLAAVRHTPDGAWETVMDYNRLYRPVQAVGDEPVVHTVMSCDLSGRGFDCGALGVVGPAGRNFYVSRSAVYLWVSGERASIELPDPTAPPEDAPPPPAVVYRMPLHCGAIGAVRARGAPLDQFSFDERGGVLRVLLRAEGAGDGMWSAESTSGDIGFLRAPVARFGEDLPTMERTAYRGLPRVEGSGESLQNRYVGDHLLYGVGSGWAGGSGGGSSSRAVWVYDVARDRTARVDVTHSIERIEPLGRDALVVGNERDGLTFSAVALDETPAVAGRHTVRGASQGETRSHGFFYLPSGDRRGTLGLPVTTGADGGGWGQLRRVSGSVMFLGVEGLRFTEQGRLRSGAGASTDDRCEASCADWYGNTRPIFWRGRQFALLGYELVEGALVDGHMREERRVDLLRTLMPARHDLIRHGAGGPTVRASLPSVSGLLSTEAIRRVVLRNLGPVNHCYEQGRATSPNLAGRVVVRFVIGGTGMVIGSNVADSSLPMPSVGECIANAVRRWQFPEPDGGGVVTVSYPFSLLPGGS